MDTILRNALVVGILRPRWNPLHLFVSGTSGCGKIGMVPAKSTHEPAEAQRHRCDDTTGPFFAKCLPDRSADCLLLLFPMVNTQYEMPECKTEHKYCQGGRGKHKGEKQVVVPAADAIADPWTVVVKSFHTIVTDRAMTASGWTINVARVAILQCHQLSLDDNLWGFGHSASHPASGHLVNHLTLPGHHSRVRHHRGPERHNADHSEYSGHNQYHRGTVPEEDRSSSVKEDCGGHNQSAGHYNESTKIWSSLHMTTAVQLGMSQLPFNFKTGSCRIVGLP
mmetsp:Transcript_22555/g.57545  ORF Transcript_22555/g.57545 Transcript_22555/m.57545 type:complete len:280 (+) Transcript_22555:387-1226(+)